MGEGLSRAAIFALVAAGIDMSACNDHIGVADYGASCLPQDKCLLGGAGGTGGEITGGSTSFSGASFGATTGSGGTLGTGGRSGAERDAGADASDASSSDAARDASRKD